jgi:hypothetical protein
MGSTKSPTESSRNVPSMRYPVKSDDNQSYNHYCSIGQASIIAPFLYFRGGAEIK